MEDTSYLDFLKYFLQLLFTHSKLITIISLLHQIILINEELHFKMSYRSFHIFNANLFHYFPIDYFVNGFLISSNVVQDIKYL